MADTTLDPEMFDELKVPIGMQCLKDPRKTCGLFKSWEMFLKWDGEKTCDNICQMSDAKSLRNKEASKDKELALKARARRYRKPTGGVMVGGRRIPYSPRKVA